MCVCGGVTEEGTRGGRDGWGAAVMACTERVSRWLGYSEPLMLFPESSFVRETGEGALHDRLFPSTAMSKREHERAFRTARVKPVLVPNHRHFRSFHGKSTQPKFRLS